MKLPDSPTFCLKGKRALVAGASSGIGLGAATVLARAGAEVTCAARNHDKLREICEALRSEGAAAQELELDITDVSAARAAIMERDPFDIVVNSAGMARHSTAIDTSPEDFDAVMNVNLRAAFFLSTAAAARMIEVGNTGSIIHISSQMGHVGGVERSVYCASKHALEGMIKAMAIEWGPAGIRINTICPTFIRTPLGEQTLQDPKRRKWIEEKIKLGRVGEIEDVMGAVLYLASDGSSLVTGTAMMIDGGWTAD